MWIEGKLDVVLKPGASIQTIMKAIRSIKLVVFFSQVTNSMPRVLLGNWLGHIVLSYFKPVLFI